MPVQLSIVRSSKGMRRPIAMSVALKDITVLIRYKTRPVPDPRPAYRARHNTRTLMIEIVVSVYPGTEGRGRPMAIKTIRDMSPAGRIIEGRPPPATPPTSPTPIETEIEPVIPEIKTETPSIPGRIDHVKTPAPGSRIIVGSKPRLIIIPRTEYYRRPVKEIIEIPRRITHIYIIGRHVVDVHIFCIIHR